MKKGRLFYFIFTIITAATLLPLLFAGFYTVSIARDIIKKNIESRAASSAARAAREADAFMSDAKSTVQLLLSLQERGGTNHITNYIDAVPLVNGIALITPQGREVGYLGALPKFDYSDMLPEVLRNTIEAQQVFMGSVRRNLYRKQLLTRVSYPIAPEGGGPSTGAAVAEFNLQNLTAALSRITPADGLTLMLTRSGFLIYSSKDNPTAAPGDAYKEKIVFAAANAEDGAPAVFAGNGFVAAVEVVPSTGWIVYVELPMQPAEAVFKGVFPGRANMLIFILLLVLTLCAGAALMLAVGIVRPVKIMTKAVNMVEAGEVNDLPALPVPYNEIGVLSIAFARMLDSIKLKIDAMAQDRHDLAELNQSLEIRVGSRTKELRTALNELIKKERLAAIGQMASIVSHEIRNPLAVMANSLYLIKARSGENADPRILKNIAIIEQEIKQANGIIEEILGYARSREQIFTNVDLNLYVKEILSSYPIPQNIKVVAEYASKPLPVRIDTEEMKQAVRNIIGNSLEVMPSGGQLIVKTKIEGDNAVLSIRDTGSGIPKDVQDKIFNPFFTTKSRGTGLGLAVVKKVVSRNDADIMLQSEEGKGTKISIILKLRKENI